MPTLDPHEEGTTDMAVAPPKKRTKQAAALPSLPERKPFVLTSKLADLAQQQRDAVHDFPLESTMPGAFARVRWVTLNDTASVMDLPASMRETIIDQVIKTGEQVKGASPLAAGIAMYQAAAVVHRAYCVAGFVEPKLIVDESERTGPGQVLVDNIHSADRARFFEWCKANDPSNSERDRNAV